MLTHLVLVHQDCFQPCEIHWYNTLLFVCRVVLLVVSSGYIGLRIVALEEQLTSLGALPEFTLHSGYDALGPCSLVYKARSGLISKSYLQ